jgi:hypothetical protein
VIGNDQVDLSKNKLDDCILMGETKKFIIQFVSMENVFDMDGY